MYDPANPAKRLPVTAGGDGDRLLLDGVNVGPALRPPSLDELAIAHPMNRQLGGFRLLGYSLTLVGQDAERDTFAAGDDAHLTLFWEALSPSPAGAQLQLALSDPTGKPSTAPANASRPLTSGALLPQHPSSSWLPGDRYRDQHRFRLPADAKGDFDLDLWLDGADGTQLARIHIR